MLAVLSARLAAAMAAANCTLLSSVARRAGSLTRMPASRNVHWFLVKAAQLEMVTRVRAILSRSSQWRSATRERPS